MALSFLQNYKSMKSYLYSLCIFLFCMSFAKVSNAQNTVAQEDVHQTFLYFDIGLTTLNEESKSSMDCLIREFRKTDTVDLGVYGFSEPKGILETRASFIQEYLKQEGVNVKTLRVTEGHEFLKRTTQNRKALVVLKKAENTPIATVTPPKEDVKTVNGVPVEAREKAMSFTTESGVRVNIPVDAFAPLSVRDFDVEVLSYFNPCEIPDSIYMEDIDGNCLVSKGIIFINVYDMEGNLVKPNLKKPILVQFPTNTLDQDLYLHIAQKGSNGRTVWRRTNKELSITLKGNNYYNFEIDEIGGYSVNKEIPAFLCNMQKGNYDNGYVLQNDMFGNDKKDVTIFATYSAYPIPFDVQRKGSNMLVLKRFADPDNTFVVGLSMVKKNNICKVYAINKRLSDLKFDQKKSVYIIQATDFVESDANCGPLPSACDVMKFKSKKKPKS